MRGEAKKKEGERMGKKKQTQPFLQQSWRRSRRRAVDAGVADDRAEDAGSLKILLIYYDVRACWTCRGSWLWGRCPDGVYRGRQGVNVGGDAQTVYALQRGVAFVGSLAADVGERRGDSRRAGLRT